MDKVHSSGGERQFQNLLELEEYLPEWYRNPPTEFEKDGHYGVDLLALLAFFDALLDDDPMSIGLVCGLDISLLGIVNHESTEYKGEWVVIPNSRVVALLNALSASSEWLMEYIDRTILVRRAGETLTA